MRFIFEENQELIRLKTQLAKAIEGLLVGLEPTSALILIPAATDVRNHASSTGIYILREGFLSVSFDDRELFVLEEGDAVFFDADSAAQLRTQSDFATRVDFYSAAQIAKGERSCATLISCVALQQALFAHLLALLFKGEKRSNPLVRNVKAGEVIISEGEISDQVFTLIEGHAAVSTAGHVVGEVNVDELIGVIGALCDIPRIATVTATKDSLLMSLGKDEFVDLLSLRPHTVVKLIKDFARIISSSNQELLSLKKG